MCKRLFFIVAVSSLATGCSTIKSACDEIKALYEREVAAGEDLIGTKKACEQLKKDEEQHQDKACPAPDNENRPEGEDGADFSLYGAFDPNEAAFNYDGRGNSVSAAKKENDAEAVCDACNEAAALCASLGITSSPNGPLVRCCQAGEN